MTINRRDLLRGSGMAAAVAASGIVPLEAEAQRLPTKWDHTADVVVIGSGASGYASIRRGR
ncbi:MAG TPA: twin-arginine translocation signal domain-containing protein [Stellaceae bacterium]|nr:twin-arginine translocation signal domain-containing protein [Stellaceae bacterium]